MTMHSPHPDTHEHGLYDGCPRCMEHAEHPIQSLDATNLRRLMAIATDPDRLVREDYTHLDRVAAAKVLTAMEQAGHLARTSPTHFFAFLSRYGVSAERVDLLL